MNVEYLVAADITEIVFVLVLLDVDADVLCEVGVGVDVQHVSHVALATRTKLNFKARRYVHPEEHDHILPKKRE